MGCWVYGRLHEQFGDSTKEQYSDEFWLGARLAMAQEVDALNNLPLAISQLHNGPIAVDLEAGTVGRDMVVNKMGDFALYIDNYQFFEPSNAILGQIQTFHFVAAGRAERELTNEDRTVEVVRVATPI